MLCLDSKISFFRVHSQNHNHNGNNNEHNNDNNVFNMNSLLDGEWLK